MLHICNYKSKFSLRLHLSLYIYTYITIYKLIELIIFRSERLQKQYFRNVSFTVIYVINFQCKEHCILL